MCVLQFECSNIIWICWQSQGLALNRFQKIDFRVPEQLRSDEKTDAMWVHFYFAFCRIWCYKYFYIIMWLFWQWKHWSFSVNHLIILCLKKSANKLTIILLNLSVVNMKFLFVNALFVLTKIVNNVFVLSDLLAHECYIGVQLNYWIIQISLFTWGNCFLLKQFRLNKLLELCLMSNWVYKLD